MIWFKLCSVLFLCLGFINHLTDSLSFAFGGEHDMIRFCVAMFGYIGFVGLWTLGDKLEK